MQLDWLDTLYKIFEVAIVPILGAATVYIVSLIRVKKEELLEVSKNDTTKKYLEMLDKIITECVLATNQTYVDALKRAGSFDIEAQKQAFKLTYEAIMAILTDDALECLKEAINDLDAYITNKIESQVAITKH